ncbi:MAG: MG2 domain-containing protein, partial [Prevotella sp.]|nr:MG2 domain-containing protein [Prevotella sp.]
MKKILFLILSIVLFLPSTLKADNYKQLWREVQASAQKDLPQSEASSLRRIISKATQEASYGNLLKAESRLLDVMSSISNDSIGPIVDEIKALEEKSESTDPALSAVLNTVLGKIYESYPFLSDDAKEKTKQFYAKALEDPALLASKKALSYEPFVIHGVDSRLFNNDLLSLLGQQTEGYDVMRSYYMTTPNRVATMLSSLWMLKKNVSSQAEGLVLLRKSPYLASLDSLINLYGDLEACCEVAIERYRYMAMCSDVTVEDRYTFLNTSIGRWGGWKSAHALRNELTTLTNPFLNCSINSKVIFSDGKAMLALESRNIQTIKIVTSRLTIDGDTNLSPDDDEGYKELKKHINPISVNTKEKKYIGQPEYRTLEDSIDLGTLPVGVYLLEVSTKKKSVKKMRSLLYVTSMYVINEKLPQNKTRTAVVNASSGQPIKEATLELGLNNGKTMSVSLDEKGEYIFSSDTTQINSLRAWTPTDKASPPAYSWNNFSYYDNKGEKDVLNLYTDRKVYRPGQTVHVTAILLSNQDGISTKAIGQREFTLSLKGANSKEIGQVKVTTDDYGTAAADFTLPQDGLTGNFQLSATDGAQGNLYVRVEEYVRPTFQVEFPEINSKYSPGDTLEVTAHATSYSGVPVQGAKVRYQIKRSGALWWRFYSPSGSFAKEDVIFSRETITDDDGAFIVEIPMLLPEWTKDSGISESEFTRLSRIYTITATADVTDPTGETREGELSLPLGNKPIAFACDIPSIVPRDSLKTVTFTLKNSQGANVSGTVRYYVDSSFNAFTARANTKTEITWNTKETLPSGKHTLTAYCEGDTLRQEFTIFGLDDKKPATQTPAWFYLTSDQFPEDGSPVYLQIGSSENSVHVLYTAMSGSQVIDSGTIELNNEVITHALKYDEKYGSGLLISVAWVKSGKLYTHNFSIKRGLPDKKLNLKWSTFRDRLTPGQKEEWTLTITHPNGKAAVAQLLSTMYDASLDDIMPQKWSFTDNIYQNLPSAMWKGSSFDQLSLGAYGSSTPLNVKHLEFNSLDLASISFSNYTPRFLTRLGGVRAPRMLSLNLSETEAPVETISLAAVDETQTNAQDNSSSAQPLKSSLRENLSETAFFFSNLLSDSKGNVKIKFTLPESLTSWRFLGLAHDKDMNYGLIEATILASKTVMIQPNMPRFVRKGDKASISSKVFNSSDRDVKAQVTIRLKDAETLTQVYQKSTSVSIKANKTETVSFYYEVKESPSLLICDITVTGNDFSDGERHYLPVLPNSESVTYSMPITDSKAGTSTFDISEIVPKKAKDGRLTIEFTQNPAWLMIGALKYINEQKADNAISLASALYANQIGKFIID